MGINRKLKLVAKKLLFLSPILLLGLSLSSGIAYASSSGYAADGVLGQSSYTSDNDGSASDQFYYPNSTVIDTVNHRLFVSDFYNDRIQVYQLSNSDQLESQSADYSLGAANPNSVGNDALNQNSIDYHPYAMAYDPINNRLFVEDYYRVLVFDLSNGISNDMPASYVIGEPNFTTDNDAQTQNSLDEAGIYGGGLAFDPVNDRLFVSDYERILVFNVSPSTLQTNGNGENASYVIGQPNFTAENYGCTQNEISESYYDEASTSLAFDSVNQRLFVSDGYECSRVLVFNVSPSTLQANGNGENASYVIGQTNFTNTGYAIGQDTLYGPAAIGYDPNGDTLFVGDYYGNRILLFNVSPSTLQTNGNGENAYAIIGQPNFASANSGTSQTEIEGTYYGAGGYAIDPTDNQLFLPDEENNRVLTYNFVSINNSSTLASATIGTSYSQTLDTSGSQGVVSFAVTGGSLPPGLTLNTTTGTISGKPTTAGTYTFEITAYDNNGTIGTFEDDPSYTITVDGISSSSVSAPDTGYGTPQGDNPTVLIVGSSGIIILGLGVRFIYRRRNAD